jgi:hypothetical protein
MKKQYSSGPHDYLRIIHKNMNSWDDSPVPGTRIGQPTDQSIAIASRQRFVTTKGFSTVSFLSTRGFLALEENGVD